MVERNTNEQTISLSLRRGSNAWQYTNTHSAPILLSSKPQHKHLCKLETRYWRKIKKKSLRRGPGSSKMGYTSDIADIVAKHKSSQGIEPTTTRYLADKS